jgi:hypothetical protein
MTTTSQFKTMLMLYMPFRIQQEEVGWGRGKTSRSEHSSMTAQGGLLLSDQQEITIMTTSVVTSGKELPIDSPDAAPTVVKEAVATQITTTPHKESNQEEVEVSS